MKQIFLTLIASTLLAACGDDSPMENLNTTHKKNLVSAESNLIVARNRLNIIVREGDSKELKEILEYLDAGIDEVQAIQRDLKIY